ncbi:MAG: hypothetical protein EBS05_06560 [Proteobacteria bacterium]|nr:hypothetical protein [Pseudomonadota bacterium]
MSLPSNAIGQAIFIRTGVPEYVEVPLPFQTLEELVHICSHPQPGLTLERVVIYSMQEDRPCALTLGFISSSKGIRSDHPAAKVQY